VDEPSTGIYYGGDIAAPVFSRVMAVRCARSAWRRMGHSSSVPQQYGRQGGNVNAMTIIETLHRQGVSIDLLCLNYHADMGSAQHALEQRP